MRIGVRVQFADKLADVYRKGHWLLISKPESIKQH